MAKGPIITERVKNIMAEVYLDHPDWRAKEIQYEISRRLFRNSPGLSAVQKYLTELRKRDDARPPELQLLDKPWTIGTSLGFDIPFQVVPILLQICKNKHDLSEDPLSIRQARWIGHLHALSRDINALEIWSLIYSTIEKMHEIRDMKFITDTSDLDSVLLDESVTVLRDLINGTVPISDAINRALRALMIQREESLGLSLDDPDFITPNYYFDYIFWLGQGIHSKSSQEVSIEEQTEIAWETRDRLVKQSEQQYKESLFLLIMVYDRELVKEMIKHIKEAKNEGPHSQEIQE